MTAMHVRQCRHHINKVFEGYSTLQYMNSGQVSVRIDRTQYGLNGRYFWSAWPGPKITFHASSPSGTWDHRYIAFQGTLVKQWTEAGLFPILPQQSPSDNDYALRMDDLFLHANSNRKWSRIRAVNLMESILIDLAESREVDYSPPEWINSITHKLSQHSASGVNYDTLSEQMGISTRTLRRNFLQKKGISPHQFLINERILHARQLLLNTDLPLKEISQKTGYSDVFYFSRQFKHITGTSPARFRQSREG